MSDPSDSMKRGLKTWAYTGDHVPRSTDFQPPPGPYNERNVAALVDAIEAMFADSMRQGPVYGSSESMARFLASRGVLVPASLSDNEVKSLEFKPCPNKEGWFWTLGEPHNFVDVYKHIRSTPDDLREGLARVARGDEQGGAT